MKKSTCIIIGAGPAGLQLGYFLQRAGRNYLILESEKKPASFFKTYPKHRKLISINKRHTGSTDTEINLRTDWNSLLSDAPEMVFTKYSERYFPSANDLVNYLEDFAHTFKLNIQYNTYINNIKKKENNFLLTSSSNEIFSCSHLIIATGLSKPYLPKIPGIEYVSTYANASIEAKNYTNKKVLIIGKGNSAFETADNLIETTAAVHVAGPSSIKFAWQTHYVGDLRAINNNLLDTYQLKSQNAILDGNIVSIKKQGDTFSVTFSFVRSDDIQKQMIYDHVIACTGFRFDNCVFDDQCRPALAIKHRFPAQTSGWESVNIPNLFFAGVLMHQRDYKKSTSGFIHGFRYCIQSLFRILEQRYYNKQWPSRTLVNTASKLTEAIITRINRTSALWQQFGFLSDLIVVNKQQAYYYEELPVDYIQQSEWGNNLCYFIITLDYGPDHAAVDPFNIAVNRVAQDDANNAMNAQYLHPIIRHFSNTQLIAEHHIAENLENQWNGPAHINPLLQFLTQQLTSYLSPSALHKPIVTKSSPHIGSV